MKRKILLLSGFAALVFAACSNDNDGFVQEPNPTEKPSVVEGVPTYATLSIGGGSKVGSRAAIEESTADKDNIGAAVVLIYNSISKVLEQKIDVAAGEVSKTFLSTSGSKRILALANMTSDMSTKLDGLQEKNSTLDQLLMLIDEQGANTSLIPTGALLPMSTPDAGTVYTLDAGVTEADAPMNANNNIDLSVKRMVAKVKLALGGSVPAKLTGVKFSIGNIPLNTYLIQHAVGNIVKSPLYDTDWTKVPDGDFAQNFMAKEGETNELGKAYYLTENTAVSFSKGSASHLILNGKYIPETIIVSSKFNVGTQTVDLTGEKGSEANSTEFCYIATSDLPFIPQGTYFKTKKVLTDAIENYNNGTGGTTAELAKLTYAVYDKGSFYRINIGKGKGSDTAFGVERNNQYEVTVSTVTGPGYSTKNDAELGGDKGKPTDPIDQKTYLNVTIKVTPWGTVDQDAEIN